MPQSLIGQKCVDALWNEHFQRRVRAVIVGNLLPSEYFEQTIKRRNVLSLPLKFLMATVGNPMIFAGEEFCDQMDSSIYHHLDKQFDPVNYERKSNDWRTEIFEFAKRQVALRKKRIALGSDHVDFIHQDFDFGR